MVSLRQITDTNHTIDWRNTNWLIQMSAFSILGDSLITTASAQLFQGAVGAAQTLQLTPKLLWATLVALPAMATFTVPFSYYEQKLQTMDTARLTNLYRAGDIHQILRRMPPWLCQKGLSRASFMCLNERLVERFGIKDSQAKQMLLGLVLSVSIHGVFWPLHWMTVQLAADQYRNTSVGGIFSDLYDRHDGQFKEMFAALYAGFLMHCLSYIISGVTESLTLALLRPDESAPAPTEGNETPSPHRTVHYGYDAVTPDTHVGVIQP